MKRFIIAVLTFLFCLTNNQVESQTYTDFILLVLLTIFFFGPESLSGFILTMLFWVTVGTYSSIFNASPLLYQMNKDKKLTVYKKIVINPEDKIVV